MSSVVFDVSYTSSKNGKWQLSQQKLANVTNAIWNTATAGGRDILTAKEVRNLNERAAFKR
jgi:hypothetical protein